MNHALNKSGLKSIGPLEMWQHFLKCNFRNKKKTIYWAWFVELLSDLTHRKPSGRKYKDYVYRKMLVQEYLKKWRIFKRVKPKNDMMYHDIYGDRSTSVLVMAWFRQAFAHTHDIDFVGYLFTLLLINIIATGFSFFTFWISKHTRPFHRPALLDQNGYFDRWAPAIATDVICLIV